MPFNFENHAFLFFSAFRCATIRDERLSYIYPSYFELSVNVLAPLLSSPCNALSLYWASKAIKKSQPAQDAGGLTSEVNGSVMTRLVIPIQAILDPLQGN